MATALVTGGSKGFGRALVAALVADGHEVVADARDAAMLAEVAAALGRRLHPLAGDVADPAPLAALVDAATELGGLDLLVNNASGLGPSPLPSLRDVDRGVLAALFETNVV